MIEPGKVVGGAMETTRPKIAQNEANRLLGMSALIGSERHLPKTKADLKEYKHPWPRDSARDLERREISEISNIFDL